MNNNYYKSTKEKIEENIKYIKESLNECEPYEKQHINTQLVAYEFANKFLDEFFKNNLKQYNNDESKAYDQFSAKKFAECLNVYTEQIYLLDKVQTDQVLAYRKQLRNIVHVVNNCINKRIN